MAEMENSLRELIGLMQRQVDETSQVKEAVKESSPNSVYNPNGGTVNGPYGNISSPYSTANLQAVYDSMNMQMYESSRVASNKSPFVSGMDRLENTLISGFDSFGKSALFPAAAATAGAGAMAGGASGVSASLSQNSATFASRRKADRQFMENYSSRFIDFTESNNPDAIGGFNAADSQRLANSMDASWLRYGTSRSNLTAVRDTALSYNMFADVGNAEEFETTLKAYIEESRTVAKALKTTSEAAMGAIGEFQRYGGDVESALSFASQSAVAGTVTGRSAEEQAAYATSTGRQLSLSGASGTFESNVALTNTVSTVATKAFAYVDDDLRTKRAFAGYSEQDFASTALNATSSLLSGDVSRMVAAAYGEFDAQGNIVMTDSARAKYLSDIQNGMSMDDINNLAVEKANSYTDSQRAQIADYGSDAVSEAFSSDAGFAQAFANLFNMGDTEKTVKQLQAMGLSASEAEAFAMTYLKDGFNSEGIMLGAGVATGQTMSMANEWGLGETVQKALGTLGQGIGVFLDPTTGMISDSIRTGAAGAWEGIDTLFSGEGRIDLSKIDEAVKSSAQFAELDKTLSEAALMQGITSASSFDKFSGSNLLGSVQEATVITAKRQTYEDLLKQSQEDTVKLQDILSSIVTGYRDVVNKFEANPNAVTGG